MKCLSCVSAERRQLESSSEHVWEVHTCLQLRAFWSEHQFSSNDPFQDPSWEKSPSTLRLSWSHRLVFVNRHSQYCSAHCCLSEYKRFASQSWAENYLAFAHRKIALMLRHLGYGTLLSTISMPCLTAIQSFTSTTVSTFELLLALYIGLQRESITNASNPSNCSRWIQDYYPKILKS